MSDDDDDLMISKNLQKNDTEVSLRTMCLRLCMRYVRIIYYIYDIYDVCVYIYTMTYLPTYLPTYGMMHYDFFVHAYTHTHKTSSYIIHSYILRALQ